MHHDVLNKLTVLLGTRLEKGIIWSRLDIAVKSDQKKSWLSIQNSNFPERFSEPWFSEPQFSEILDLMNKLQLPFSYFTLYPDSI